MSDKVAWQFVPISSFLTCREGKYKPETKEVCDLQRLSKIDFSGQIHVSNKPSKTDMIIVMPHDLVISGINVAKGAIAVHQGDKPIAATIHYSAYTFDETKIDIEYFKRFLQSPIFVETLQAQVKGGIKTEIKPKQFLPLMIHLPELEVQKEVAQYFQSFEQELFELSDELNQQDIYIKKLRQAILQEAIEGKLTAGWRANNPVIKGDPNTDTQALLAQIQVEKQRLIAEGKLKKDKPLALINDAEKPFELPDGWIWVRLGTVCNKITDGFHNTPKKIKRGGFVYISATHVKNGFIDWQNCDFVDEVNHHELSLKAYPQKGEVLIVNIGAGCGVSAIIDVEYEFSFKNVAILKFNQELMVNQYLQIYLQSQRDNIYSDLTKGGLQPFLSLKVLNNIFFPLPSVSEQKKIIEKVQYLLAQVDALETELKNRQVQTEQLMQAVLTEAFSPSL